MTDRNDKRGAVLGLLQRHGASSLLLTSTGSLQWYLDGARVHIDLASGPILTVRVSADGDDVHLGSNEAERMLAEELPGDVRVLTHPRGAEPLVVLVGGESRSALRHPLPTADPLGRRAMLVICARRHGLVANATRWVRFGAASAEETDADARILEVEADVFAATRAGATLGEVLTAIRSAYPRHGFDPEEWLGHHQGGSAGYGTRETLATPDSAAELALGQAFAWNPTAPGAKVEDTVLLTETGVEPLTVDSRWPTTTVRGVERPVVLER